MKEKFKRLDEMLKLRAEIKKATVERDATSEKIAEMVRKSSGRFSDIRKRFAKMIRDVLGRNAELYVRPNDNGNLEFRAEFQEGGLEEAFTSESKGTTYKKFLCMAFDAAVAEACCKERFFHFIYHDGALETADDRRKMQWLETVRTACTEYGIQYVMTVIDDDVPRDGQDKKIDFDPAEIIRELHDQGDDGRLFKMPRF